MIGDLPTHREKEVERKFCFEYDTDCDHHKMMKVLWCPSPNDVDRPFYIYQLKQTEENFGYCTVEHNI